MQKRYRVTFNGWDALRPVTFTDEYEEYDAYEEHYWLNGDRFLGYYMGSRRVLQEYLARVAADTGSVDAVYESGV